MAERRRFESLSELFSSHVPDARLSVTVLENDVPTLRQRWPGKWHQVMIIVYEHKLDVLPVSKDNAFPCISSDESLVPIFQALCKTACI